MFKIKDIEFEINSAIVEAFIDDEKKIMEWAIEITSNSADRDDIKWRVKLSSESILKTTENQLTSWKDIAGITFSWHEKVDMHDNEHGLMYVFQHEPVYECKGTFYLNEDNNVCVNWSGKCDIFWNEDYNQGLAFLIDTPIVFKGVWFGKDIEPVCKQSLLSYITNESFEYTIERNVSLLKPLPQNQ